MRHREPALDILLTKMRESKLKAILLASLMVLGTLQPKTFLAQSNGAKGLFGKGDVEGLILFEENNSGNTMVSGNDGLIDYYDYDGGLFNRGNISSGGLANEGFGEIPTGITNEPFQQDAPLGNELLIMLLGGFGYAILKRRNIQESNQ